MIRTPSRFREDPRMTLETSVAARRGVLAGLAALGASSLRAATGGAPPVATRSAEEQSRERLRERRAPNVALLDHNGRSLRFYDDVIKDQTVLINVMYTVCSNVCTPAMRNLIEARRLLGGLAIGLRFVSMSLTPLADTPEVLRAYKKLHGAGDDWTFLTGTLDNVERVQRALGFIGGGAGDDLQSHTAMARLCDERNLRWGHVNIMLSARSIARMIRFELV
jgi:protein SCO1